jgi:hypothetical protein
MAYECQYRLLRPKTGEMPEREPPTRGGARTTEGINEGSGPWARGRTTYLAEMAFFGLRWPFIQSCSGQKTGVRARGACRRRCVDIPAKQAHRGPGTSYVHGGSPPVDLVWVWLDRARIQFRFFGPSSFNTALQLVLRPHFLVHFV